jgi:glycosyltransferase involved in cell wall biosynthesis
VYVEAGETGYIFPTGDVTSLTERLLSCYDSVNLQRMGVAARNEVEENYSLDVIAKKLLTTLREQSEKDTK